MATPPDPSKPNSPAPHYEQHDWQVQQVINAQNVTMTAPERPAPPAPPPAPPPDPNRTKMLKQVRQQVDDVLHKSLWNEARVALRLAEGTARPYNVELQEPERPPVLLPQGTQIIEVYDRYADLILILGEPGGGKTTLLLGLAEELLDRAEADAAHPIPVAFNLSTWGKDKPTIHDWMVDQIHRTYHVPKTIGVPWVEGGHILPLLDGLDEVASERRAACVAAINDYRVNYDFTWFTPMVVCCRSEEYRTLPALQGATAINVQVLTHAEIDAYLAGGGQHLDGVRAVLRDDPTLYDMLKTPLLLSIIALAFADTTADDLRTAMTPETLRAVILTIFVRRMFAYLPFGKGEDAYYSRQRILYGLRWLAQRMDVSILTLYQMELMQPDWVNGWKNKVVRWSAALITGLWFSVIGLSVGGQIGGYIFWLMSGILGVIVGMLGSRQIKPAEKLSWSWQTVRTSWRTTLGIAWIGGLLGGLFGSVIIGFVSGLVSGLVGGFLFVVGNLRTTSMQSIYRSFQDILVGGLIGMIVVGLTSGLVRGLFGGLIGGVLGCGIGGLISGLVFDISDTHIIPNQGIYYSARNTMVSASIIGLISGCIGGLVGVWELGIENGIRNGFTLGLVGFFVGGLPYGGRVIIQHYTLRIMLLLAGIMPWNIARLFDAAANLLFLRRVGGGWVFSNRMLFEFFRDLSNEEISDLTKDKGMQNESR